MKTLFLSCCVLASSLVSAQAADLSGYDQLDIEAPHRSTLLQGSVWYPAASRTYKSRVGDNPVFYGTEVMLGAGVDAGKHPLVVLSHGSGGNMDNAGWLSSALAQAGVMVLGVNHPGSTSGDSSPRRSARFWDRPMDLDATIDAVLADPVFAPAIDETQIYTLGFSLGGLSVLQTGGMRMDLETYATYCDEKPEAVDCQFFHKGRVDFRLLDAEKMNATYRDPRLAGVIAIDPGMSVGFTEESVAESELPFLFINLGTDETLWPAINVGAGGTDLVGRLDNASYLQIAPADHFSFLALCKENGPEMLIEEGEDPICNNPEGSDRSEVHRQIIEAVLSFLAKQA
ncbi:hypothetical protein J0X15_07780 [Roseibium sp. CAU 1637]|uniref:Dienelactone hydrolase n=1 Tax=Roseibium limicola TaxID=2816037 RepID=A0A939J8Q4_9HYPH|nr:hypothetical protein [Roseibium limicola]MBO0345114.1 hypothetical protein [Roseibium limicola]